MKYLITLITILAISGSIALGQNSSAWRAFSRDIEEFTVEFPEQVKFDDLKGTVRSSTYWSRSEEIRIFIASEPRRTHPILDQAMTIINGYGMTESEISSIPAKRYRRTDDRFTYGAVTVSTEARSYVFFAVAPLGNAEDVSRFLDSVRINAKPVEKAEESVEPQVIPRRPYRAVVPEKSPFGAGRSSTEVPPPTDPMSRPQSDNSGVRILAKTSPGYTDAARFFHVEGTVILRTTFGADGAIGAVSIVSALPFGLTESAIGAARSIKFEPARRNGQPYTVVKNIEYSFRLF